MQAKRDLPLQIPVNNRLQSVPVSAPLYTFNWRLAPVVKEKRRNSKSAMFNNDAL